MKINKILSSIVFLVLFFSINSCETFDLDQTSSPSQVGVEFLDPTYTFNYVQLQLPDFVNSANDFTQRVTRQMAMTGGNTYNNAFTNVNFNENWSDGYNILNAIKIMEPKAIEKEQYYVLGASRVIRVYVAMTMVDMYGDIPFSEALQGNNNLTPKFDKSSDIYRQLLLELDEAISFLGNPDDNEIQDLYYNDKTKWITLANTLKLKMLNNARLAGTDIGIADVGIAIKAVLDQGDYIDTPDEDFAFKYGNSRFNPNTRHPLYNDQYELGGGAYIANYFMWAMTTEKWPTTIPSLTATTNVDPRTNFYFFKQYDDPKDYVNDDFTLPKKTRPEHYNDDKYKSFYSTSYVPYLISNWYEGTTMPNNGFWGRDHGDNSGIPPDGSLRTVGGIYPIGGKYGTPSSVQNRGADGAQGAGIMPILLSSYVHFIIAEAAYVYPSSVGATFNPLTELKTAIGQSIDKTINLIPDYPYTGTPPDASILATQKSFYINFIDTKYNNSATNKLEMIIKEYYLASWGNGIEPYNNYRRTGYPSNLQPTLEEASGDFFYTALYPGASVNNNPNAPANVRTKKVFWDKANIILN